jgi:hypothetical protein
VAVDNEPTVSDMVAKVSELKRDFIGICELLEITYSQHCKSAEVVDTFGLQNGKPHEWELIIEQGWHHKHGVSPTVFVYQSRPVVSHVVLPWDMKISQLNDELVHAERKAERDKKKNKGAVLALHRALIFTAISVSKSPSNDSCAFTISEPRHSLHATFPTFMQGLL